MTSKRYTVRVVDVVRFWGTVEVQAESQEDAEGLAGPQLPYEWSDSATEERYTEVVAEDGEPVEFSPEAFDLDPKNPYRKRTKEAKEDEQQG